MKVRGMIRPWEEGEARGTTDTIPFPGHRTLAEAWKAEFVYERLLASRRKPGKNEGGDAA